MREDTGAPFGPGSRPSGRASKAISPVPASIPSAKKRLTKREFDAGIDAEIVWEVRRVAREVTGGNCAFADSDVKLLGRLATLAIDAGLHEQLTDLSRYTRYNIASAIEARRADTPKSESVADESAVPPQAGDAQ